MSDFCRNNLNSMCTAYLRLSLESRNLAEFSILVHIDALLCLTLLLRSCEAENVHSKENRPLLCNGDNRKLGTGAYNVIPILT